MNKYGDIWVLRLSTKGANTVRVAHDMWAVHGLQLSECAAGKGSFMRLNGVILESESMLSA